MFARCIRIIQNQKCFKDKSHAQCDTTEAFIRRLSLNTRRRLALVMYIVLCSKRNRETGARMIHVFIRSSCQKFDTWFDNASRIDNVTETDFDTL